MSFLRLVKVVVIMLFIVQHANARDIEVSPTGTFSILTCTPGPDLYSLFGHSAIRYQDTINGRWIDWVYNYGTFQFDDDFYVKFARGKLDYLLSKQDFAYFQEEYIYTGRGIFEQKLNFTREENQRLLNLLEQNFLPENRTYRYDFFYDNCSTRIRDMIIRATSGKEDDGLGFRAPDPVALSQLSRINFSYVYPGEYSYRQAIQKYLDFQPWSDFGIDLALGLPCDKSIAKNGFMFLPDSVLNDFAYAVYADHALVGSVEELLPSEYELESDEFFTPMMVMMIVLVFHLAVGFVMLRWKRLYNLSDRLILITTGLLGVLVVFLWFFTDHTATKWNLNILWANPLNLILGVLPFRKIGGIIRIWLKVYMILLFSVLVLWFVLPQQLNLAVIPLIIALIFTTLKTLRPSFFLGSVNVGV